MYGKPELSDSSGSEFSGDIVHTTVCSPHVDLSTIHLQAKPAVNPEHAPGVEVTEAWVEDKPSDPDAVVTDKKTRCGRTVKPPVRYEPTEQVEDDSSCDDDDGGEGEGEYSDEESDEEEDEYESDFVCDDEDLEYESEDEEEDEDEYDASDDDLESDCSDEDAITEDEEEEEEEDQTHKRKKTKLAKKVMRSADDILANISAEEKDKLLKMLTGSA